MDDDKKSGRHGEAREASVNPGYAGYQLAKALTSAEEHPDPDTRLRAHERVQRWEMVLQNILSGELAYGSRAPIQQVPVWATPEVVTGGFATGRLLASGPLRPHEVKFLEALSNNPRKTGSASSVPESVAGRTADPFALPNIQPGSERAALNASFVGGDGFAQLSGMLASGCFDVEVPEEGALLAVAWLAENGRGDDARSLLAQLAPYFSQLRFYPIPRNEPDRFGSRVHLQTVAETAQALGTIEPNERILAQQESVEVWAPFHDRVVALFLETVEDTWPCRTFPEDWSARAERLLAEYSELRASHRLCRKMDRPNQHYRQLRDLLSKCASARASLTGKEVGRIRLILTQYQQKRGTPGSAACRTARQRQSADVSAPTYHAVAATVLPRLSQLPPDEGVEDVDTLCGPVTLDESRRNGVPEGTHLPRPIQRRMERCLHAEIETLVERGFITSGDTLAMLLPQITSALRSESFADPQLQRLYRAIYRAFRKRRSLLLLNLEKQVQIEELPWVKAIEPWRVESAKGQDRAMNALREVAALALTSFPYAIIPNKLLQEVQSLAKAAKLELPLVEEVAADIFRGRFSDKFVDAAKRAALVLEGTLYANYYRIDYAGIQALATSQPNANGFAKICARRAGVSLYGRTAENGMVLEQQQILTSQNLAVLFHGLGLIDALRERLLTMAMRCLSWVLRRQQTNTPDWHARLVVLKNTAYAWRQMLFFLSFVTSAELTSFVEWAKAQLDEQPEDFRIRFRPALNGLIQASAGKSFDDDSEARRFLGWSNDRHWLMPDPLHSRSGRRR